jgi:hypothetical protein
MAVYHKQLFMQEIKGKGVVRYEIYVRFQLADGQEIDTKILTRNDKTQYEGKEYPLIYLPFNPKKAQFLISLSQEKINLIYNN